MRAVAARADFPEILSAVRIGLPSRAVAEVWAKEE
jgi:hypothetical protein